MIPPRKDEWPRAVPRSRLGAAALGLAVTGMLAASAFAAPAADSAARTTSASTADCDSLTTCYTPQQIQVAYGLRSLLDRGIDGRGETVVLPAVAERQLSPPTVSDILADLTGFDRLFHLPAARLDVTTRFAPGASRWLSYGEETLDVEMIHAIAPEATIRVVLFAPSVLAQTGSLVAALAETVRAGTASGDVVSISAAVGEHCLTSAQVASLHSALQAAARHHVTVVAGSGDIGPVAEPCTIQIPPPAFTPVRGVSLPASDPLVLAAGGTSLDASHSTGAYIRETAWGLPYGNPGTEFQASGGGFSQLYPRPAYQYGVPGIGASRGVPDVSADASGHTGMALVISEGAGQYTIADSGGASAATPFWAGLIALADQYAGHDLGLVNPALYRIARGPLYHRAFHDVTSGNNTVQFPPQTFPGYRAAPGWDPVTGLGSPDAQVLVPLLARCAAPDRL
jgi:subtilase family serine protease